MSCDSYQVGMRVKAVADFRIAENLAAPVGANQHEIRSGDTGEVAQVRKAGSFHWLIIKWDGINRSLNLDRSQFEFVTPVV